MSTVCGGLYILETYKHNLSLNLMNKILEKLDGGMTLDTLATLVMNGFAHFNTKFDTRIDDLERRTDKKIDGLGERLDKRIDSLEAKVDYRFDALSIQIKEVSEEGVSCPEFKALEGRVITLENVPKAA